MVAPFAEKHFLSSGSGEHQAGAVTSRCLCCGERAAGSARGGLRGLSRQGWAQQGMPRVQGTVGWLGAGGGGFEDRECDGSRETLDTCALWYFLSFILNAALEDARGSSRRGIHGGHATEGEGRVPAPRSHAPRQSSHGGLLSMTTPAPPRTWASRYSLSADRQSGCFLRLNISNTAAVNNLARLRGAHAEGLNRRVTGLVDTLTFSE